MRWVEDRNWHTAYVGGERIGHVWQTQGGWWVQNLGPLDARYNHVEDARAALQRAYENTIIHEAEKRLGAET